MLTPRNASKWETSPFRKNLRIFFTITVSFSGLTVGRVKYLQVESEWGCGSLPDMEWMNFRHKSLALLTCSVLVWAGCGSGEPEQQETAGVYEPLPPGTVNFSDHIAPVIFENCAECHRPGQAAPFSLLTYEDVRKRSQQIMEVTQSGYMPPWLPDQPAGTFLNERILTATEKGLIKQWHEDGAPEGDPDDVPPLPDFPEGWQMGEPDMVLRLKEPFPIPAEGDDIYRNFVIPVEEMPELKFVRTVDFRPLNPRVVHHMVLLADLTTSSRDLDAGDELPGFPGIMSLTQARLPFGQFHGWTPGKEPYPGTQGISWPLQTPIDLVLQAHMQTTGKPEELQVEIGLYFAGEEPVYRPYPLVFRNKVIDIPPGESAHHIKASFQLPVDAQVLSVYPHAHYLARDMEATAHLADGTSLTLLSIPEWDFDWQDEYRYPGDRTVMLPAGTVIEFDYTYDNSAENPQNPSNPPVRVQYGQNATDEMAELMLQLLTRSPEDLMTLDQYAQYNALLTEIQTTQWKLESSPDDLSLRNLLATYYMDINDLDRAGQQFDLVLSAPAERLEANFEENIYATVTAAQIHFQKAEFDQAEELFSRAASLYSDSTNTTARAQIEFYRAELDSEKQQTDEAIAHYRKAVELEPEFADSWNAMAWMYLDRAPAGESEDGDLALQAATKAVELTERQYGPYLLTLGRVHEKLQQWDQAIAIYRETINLARELGEEQQIQRIQELIANIDLMRNQQ